MAIERTKENKLQNKNSFILYLDSADIFEQLSDEEAGQLIKAVLYYVHTGETPELNRLLLMAFTPIKQSLHRDLEKWRNEVDKRKEAGKLGGLATQEKLRQANQASACSAKAPSSKFKQVQANQADSVSVNVSVSVNDSENESVFNETLNDFRDMRKKIKKPLTKRAEELLINNLNKITTKEDEQIKILEQSIVHCWQDVYKLKDNQDSKSKYDSLVIEESEVIDV